MKWSEDIGFCHIKAFDLNSEEHTLLGEPPTLPAESFLIRYAKGRDRFHILLDAGKKGQGNHVIIPALLAQGIERIDQLIISHMHRDHYGGVIDLLRDTRITIGQIIYAPIPDEIILTKNKGAFATWKELDQLLEERASIVRILTDDDVGSYIQIDDELFWKIIAMPNLNHNPSLGINDLNVVLKLHFRRFTALFPGDCCNQQAEEILQSDQQEALNNVFLLKAAHHGKGESLSKRFIEQCNARIVLIPSNSLVASHHRHELMEHQFDYGANGAKVYRTDQYRGIDLYTDGETVECVSHTQDYTERTTFNIT